MTKVTKNIKNRDIKNKEEVFITIKDKPQGSSFFYSGMIRINRRTFPFILETKCYQDSIFYQVEWTKGEPIKVWDVEDYVINEYNRLNKIKTNKTNKTNKIYE